MARFCEIDETVPILTELKEIFGKVNNLEEVLGSGHIEDVETALAVVDVLNSALKGRELPLCVIPRLQSQIDLLATASHEKFKEEWNRSISIEKIATGTHLFVLDDARGIIKLLTMLMHQVLEYLSSNLQKMGVLEELADAFRKQLNENVLRPVVNGSSLARIDNGALLIEPSIQSESDIPENLNTVLTYISRYLPRSVLALLKTRTFPELINAILFHYLTERCPEPSSLPQTIDSLQHLNKIFIKSKWNAEINGRQWIQEVPHRWFANRQATVLSTVRSFLLTEQKSQESVKITEGIDISAVPQSGNVLKPEQVPEKTVDAGITANVDDEDEPDGWGFDAGDDDVDAPSENRDDEENNVDDAWNNWEDDEEEMGPAEPVSNAFPYAVSGIPDVLMDIVERILQEGEHFLMQE